ncbi:MAG: hypothetical protein M3065_05560 [Actinomycetota bacterium]|nr:hypothetical protein [Actinomycetota bacterium]
MNRRLALVVLGLFALATAGPAVVCLVRALVPVGLVVGVVAVVVRLVWFYTSGRW